MHKFVFSLCWPIGKYHPVIAAFKDTLEHCLFVGVFDEYSELNYDKRSP